MTSTGSSAADDPRRLADPTVLGAMRRHWLLVSLVVVACVDLALAYGAFKQDEFRASATVSAPRPAGSALQSDAQYLDSQVLLLNSRQVGDRAFQIARTTPAGASIRREELAPTVGKVQIIPPGPGASGSYGTTIVTIQFTASSAEEAQAGVNALATAYDEVRTQDIEDTAAARLRGIDQAISTADSPSDVSALRKERVRALIDQGRDLSQRASISPATLPAASGGSGLVRLGAVGLFLGLVLGGAAAFVRAVRLQHVAEPHVASRLYGAPLLHERRPGEPAGDTAELTEPHRLLGRAVAQRLRTVSGPAVVAVVSTPTNGSRSMVAANLALALADGAVPVLAVDGDDGSMARALSAGTWGAPSGREEPGTPGRTLHPALSVVDLSGPGPSAWDERLRDHRDHVVVVDCPPAAVSARAVDLLAHCTAAVVLVRADEPVPDHLEVARWLDLTGTEVLGVVFTPHARRRPRDWWPRRRAAARVPVPATPPPVPVQHSRARTAPTAQTGPATQATRAAPAPQGVRRSLLPLGPRRAPLRGKGT